MEWRLKLVSPVTRTAAVVGMMLCGCARSHPGGAAEAAEADGGRARGAATFEGTVQMSIPGTLAQSLFELKGDKVRWSLLETDPAAGYRIYDASARRLFTIDPNASSVLVSDVPLPSDAPAVASGGGAGGAGGSWAFAPSPAGRDPSAIAGHACDRILATNGALTFDVCAARDMAQIPFEYAFPNAAVAIPFLGALAANGQVPLTVGRLEGDAGRSAGRTLTVTQLRAGPIDDARFVLPDFPVTVVKHLPTPKAVPR